MIVEERFVTYINSLNTGNTPLLEEIEQEAHGSGVPIIRREMQSFLKFLLAAARPAKDIGGRDCHRVFCSFYGRI